MWLMSNSPRAQLTADRVAIGTARLAATDGGVVSAPGFYAWWLRDRSALPAVPLGEGGLAYVGIAPNGERSSASIRSRVRGDHLGAAIGSSTLRRGLAAFLWEANDWTPFMKGKKIALPADQCLALTRWMERHLLVSWCRVEEPWLHEAALIREMRPPLNSDHNRDHAFYPTLKRARERLAARARSTGVPS
jgi:hypothetical protein